MASFYSIRNIIARLLENQDLDKEMTITLIKRDDNGMIIGKEVLPITHVSAIKGTILVEKNDRSYL